MTLTSDRALDLDPAEGPAGLLIAEFPDQPEEVPAADWTVVGAYGVQRRGAAYLFTIREVGVFRLTADRIQYRFEPGLSARQQNQFLLGVVLAFWLETTGCIVLHGAAIEVGGGAVALIGARGAGKSSLALGLTRAGHRLMADDQVVIDLTASSPRVRPTTPWIKAWPETIDALALDPEQWRHVHDATTKCQLELPPARRAPTALPLRRVLILRRSASASCVTRQPLGPRAAVSELLRHATVPRLLTAAGLGGGRLAALAHIVNQVGIEELSYPGNWQSLSAVHDVIVSAGTLG